MSIRILEILAAGFIGGFTFWMLESIRSQGLRAGLAQMVPRRFARRNGQSRAALPPTEAMPDEAGPDLKLWPPVTDEGLRSMDAGAEWRSGPPALTSFDRRPGDRHPVGTEEGSAHEDHWAASSGAFALDAPGTHRSMAHRTAVVGPPAAAHGMAAEITVQTDGSRRLYTIAEPVTLIGASDRAHVPIPGARATAVVERLEDVVLVRAADEGAPVWLGGRRVGTQPVPITSSNAVLDVQPASVVVSSLAAPTPSTALRLAWIEEPPGAVVRELPGRIAAVWGDVEPRVLAELAAAALDTLVPHPSGPTWALRVALGSIPAGSDVGVLLAVTDDDEGIPVCRLSAAGALDVRCRQSDDEPWTSLPATSLDESTVEPIAIAVAPLALGSRVGVEVLAAHRRLRVDLSVPAGIVPAIAGA